MSKPTRPTYKTRNWPAYNEALKRRGSLTIWFDPAMIWEAAPTGKRGRQPDYSGEEDEKRVVSRRWWKFSGGDLRALGFGPDQATRSRVIGSMG